MKNGDRLRFIIFILKAFKLRASYLILLSVIQALFQVFSVFALIACLLSLLDSKPDDLNGLWLRQFIDLSTYKFHDILLFLCLVYLIRNISLIVIAWCKENICGQITEEISTSTYRMVLGKEITFFNHFSAGNFIESVLGESELTKEVLVSLVNIFTELIIIGCIFAALIFYDPDLSLGILFPIIFGAIVYSLCFRKINIKLGRK
ncbi:hypothetical protein N9O43_02325, partial [Burkholderiales bacterium]|nr:hypothetical protein [Burkholderiales bacterium]